MDDSWNGSSSTLSQVPFQVCISISWHPHGKLVWSIYKKKSECCNCTTHYNKVNHWNAICTNANTYSLLKPHHIIVWFPDLYGPDSKFSDILSMQLLQSMQFSSHLRSSPCWPFIFVNTYLIIITLMTNLSLWKVWKNLTDSYKL